MGGVAVLSLIFQVLTFSWLLDWIGYINKYNPLQKKLKKEFDQKLRAEYVDYLQTIKRKEEFQDVDWNEVHNIFKMNHEQLVQKDKQYTNHRDPCNMGNAREPKTQGYRWAFAFKSFRFWNRHPLLRQYSHEVPSSAIIDVTNAELLLEEGLPNRALGAGTLRF